jgi:hypothetical protein
MLSNDGAARCAAIRAARAQQSPRGPSGAPSGVPGDRDYRAVVAEASDAGEALATTPMIDRK